MIRTISIGLVGLFMIIPVAQADEHFDQTHCWSSTTTMLSASEELTVLSYELTGINRSNLETKAFDNATTNCIGVMRIMAGVPSVTGYCKYMEPDGDFVVGEYKSDASGTKTEWKFLQGTGKWKGIQGTGQGARITRAKPIKPGTSQGCNRETGTYKLPKQPSNK